MKKKISLFILCGVILLGLCGCGNKETTFQLSYEKISDDLIITSGSTGYKIILPTNTKFFEKPDVLKGIFKFYDYSNGERIEDISYSTNIDVSKAGIYTIDIEGKYNEKIGTTQLEVELVESCSGTCTINTTNWNIELDGTFTYGDYSPNYILKVKSTFSPNASAFEFNTKTEQYEPINDGFINLYYKNYAFYNTEQASTYNYGDNAISQNYQLNEKKENMYVQFTSITKLEGEAFIDFYDKVAKKHNFYIVN